MAQKSELFSSLQAQSAEADSAAQRRRSGACRRSLLEIAMVFGLSLVAVWTPQGRLNHWVSVVAAGWVVGLAISGESRVSEMGLTHPLRGAGFMLLTGAVLCGVITLVGYGIRFAGAGYGLPWSRSWQYLLWSLQQEFILQSIFFVRLESLFGSRRAVISAACLFSIAHIPSPVLTLLSFAGGILFCELFRRFRNLYPLGAIHGALGLTIAASMPDKWLHHMRVGLGYLTTHS
jgi:hypothetical protein